MGQTLKRQLIGAIVLIAIATVALFILLPNPHSQSDLLARSDVLARSDNLNRDSTQAPPSAVSLAYAKQPATDRREKEQRVAKSTKVFPGRWAVQVGSFTKKSNAQSLLRQIQALDLPVFTRRVTSDARQMTRVLVGPFTAKTTATEFMTKLREKAIPARVVHHP